MRSELEEREVLRVNSAKKFVDGKQMSVANYVF